MPNTKNQVGRNSSSVTSTDLKGMKTTINKLIKIQSLIIDNLKQLLATMNEINTTANKTLSNLGHLSNQLL